MEQIKKSTIIESSDIDNITTLSHVEEIIEDTKKDSINNVLKSFFITEEDEDFDEIKSKEKFYQEPFIKKREELENKIKTNNLYLNKMINNNKFKISTLDKFIIKLKKIFGIKINWEQYLPESLIKMKMLMYRIENITTIKHLKRELKQKQSDVWAMKHTNAELNRETKRINDRIKELENLKYINEKIIV